LLRPTSYMFEAGRQKVLRVFQISKSQKKYSKSLSST
jgi:hypothetical protein